MDRDQIFGRLIAIASILGERVFEKGKPSLDSNLFNRYKREPSESLRRIHENLMEYAHKFGPEELALLDIFGELMASLKIEDFTNEPLKGDYLLSYYRQRNEIHLVGTAEVASLLGWSKQQVSVYVKRAEEYRREHQEGKRETLPPDIFPKEFQRLASGPIWLKKQIEDYRDSRR